MDYETAMIYLPKEKSNILRKITGEKFLNRAIYKVVDRYIKEIGGDIVDK